MSSGPAQLIWPELRYLPDYAAALERGWSPDNTRGETAAREELDAISSDAQQFLASLIDREAKGGPVVLPDGSRVPRLPGYRRWVWDGEFCGSIGFRWQPGTSELPAHVLGHVGYSIVPWKRGRGYAKLALRALLEDARVEGLDRIEITTDVSNIASQRVVIANGGTLVESFIKPPQYGGAEALRFQILLR